MAAIGALSSFLATAAQAGAQSALAGISADAQAAAAPDTGVPASIPSAPGLETVLAAIAAVSSKQDGLASLLAGLKSLLAAQTDMPANVRDAANALLARKAEATDGRVEASAIKTAITQSGLGQGRAPEADIKSSLVTLRDALRVWSAETGASGLAQNLIDKADNAIARHDILQAVSLPDTQGDRPMRLVFDIPLQTPQGLHVAQMAIERDGRNDSDDPEQKTWRASFSIDLEPLGPVHATVAMQGGRAAVTFLAERRDSAHELREHLPMLQAAFGEAALEAGELECREGTPMRATSPGALMDRAT